MIPVLHLCVLSGLAAAGVGGILFAVQAMRRQRHHNVKAGSHVHGQ